jgi:hypothetical protein
MDNLQIEKRIIRQAAKSLIEAGFSVRVHDGEEYATEKTTSLVAIMAEVFATEETYFHAFKDGQLAGQIWFIHGNGCDVITDNSESMEEVLKPAQDLAESLC